MSTRDTILEAYAKLVQEGQRILSASGWDGKQYRSHPGDKDYLQFRIGATNLVRRSCGEDSDHYQQLKRLAEGGYSAVNSYYFVHCLGVLEAARSDFEAGLLFDMRALISAELLGDFLAQSEALLAAGYHIPAASLAGAVLEDTLRQLCRRRGIALPTKTKIDALNADLARDGAYDKLVQKRIVAMADIRNNADHGHFDKFNDDDVADMVKWLGRFTSDYLQ